MKILENLDKYNVILASASPRRQELLEKMGVKFSVKKAETDEYFPENFSGAKIVKFLAQKKAAAISLGENDLVIAADTLVFLDGFPLGKPQNLAHAREILQKISGKKHTVITGVCVRTKKKKITFSQSSTVEFLPFSEAEIAHYLATAAPLDRAGAYGIQDFISIAKAKKINGSFFNVMGLPTSKLYEILQKF